MTELSANARSLLRAAREERGLSAEERARVRMRVLSRTGALGAAASAAAGASAKVAVAKAASALPMTLVAVATSLTLAGGGAFYAASAARVAAPPVLVKSRPIPLSTRALEAPEPRAHAEAPTQAAETSARSAEPQRTESVVRTAPASSSDQEFAEDARVLRAARAALAAGQAERALLLLERRRGKHSGVLAEEREAARIVTLCQLGRRDEARAARDQFLLRHASSPLVERVRRACPPAERGDRER
jgi:hypothetical protein